MLPYQNGNDDKQFLEELGKLVSPWLQVSESLGSEETEIIQHQESQLFAAVLKVGFTLTIHIVVMLSLGIILISSKVVVKLV